MPKYLNFKVAGYYWYFTAKFFVKDNGDSVLQKHGVLTDKEISIIQKCIKANYKEMYEKWSQYSPNGFYQGN